MMTRLGFLKSLVFGAAAAAAVSVKPSPRPQPKPALRPSPATDVAAFNRAMARAAESFDPFIQRRCLYGPWCYRSTIGQEPKTETEKKDA